MKQIIKRILNENKEDIYLNYVVDNFINQHVNIEKGPMDFGDEEDYFVVFQLPNNEWDTFSKKGMIKWMNEPLDIHHEFDNAFISSLEKYDIKNIKTANLIWKLVCKEIIRRMELLEKSNLNESDESKRDKFIRVVADDIFTKTYINKGALFNIVTPFDYTLSSSWFKKPKSERILERPFINKFYRYVSETYGVDINDGYFIEKVMSLYFDQITNKVKDIHPLNEDLEYYGVDDASPESDEYKMGLKEDIPIYKQDTPYKSMYEQLRWEFANTPEYILKDFYYNHIVSDKKVVKQIMTQFWGDPVMYIGDYWKRYLRGPWKLQIIEVNPMDFTDRTVRAFIQREFGEVDAYQVKDDKQRMDTQKKLATKGGSNEPIIVEKTKNGKYDLIEGWHRTMATLLLGDNGEDMKNWGKVKLRAFVKEKR